MNLSWLKKYNLLIFDEIDSTNSEAMRLAKSGVSGNFIIWAQSQVAGRGRSGKNWQSKPGNFYVSLLLSHNIEPEVQPELSFITALAVFDTIDFFAKKEPLHLNLSVKWPNDLMIGHKKVAGILLESVNIAGNHYLIIGIGINIKNSPQNIDKPTTSLLEQELYSADAGRVLDIFIRQFDRYLAQWQNKGFAKTRQEWLKHAYKLNEVVIVDDGKNRISGKFKDIDMKGGMVIQLPSGQMCSLSAGEVFFGTK